MTVAIVHTTCGGVAFRVRELPRVGAAMSASDVVEPEGVKDGDPITCSSCGVNAHPGDLLPEGGVWA